MEHDPQVSRRGLMGAGIAMTGAGLFAANAQASTPTADTHVWMAKQQVAELRQLYGFATDLIGTAEKSNVDAGRDIYRRIFSADAEIGAANVPTVRGPDAWVEIVLEALRSYASTQHLIGTQHVEVHSLPGPDGRGGRASMQSYLQAWHAQADGELWLFIGTYFDEASYSSAQGWQIHKMVLQQVSEDRRKLGG